MDPNRRHQFRKVPEELAFLQLERDDGGTVLDVSEGGLRFETFAPVLQNGPVHLWFSLNLRDRIEAWGEVVWTNAAKKSGGLRFLRLSEEARTQIRKWMAEFPSRHVSDGKAALSIGADGMPAKNETGKWDAVATFVSKARPQRMTLLAGREDSGNVNLGASTGQETVQPVSGLVPVQKYLEAKRKQLIFGIFLGMCISATFAMVAFKVSNYLRQTRDAEKLAAESRAAGFGTEVQPPAPAVATPATTHPGSGDIFSPGKQKRAAFSDNAPNNLKATATWPPRSRTTEPPGLAASAESSSSRQPHSNDDASQRQGSRSPAQLWASVQAGNSKAAVELAELYIQGEGVPRNCAQARVLLLVASEKRNAGAIKRLQDLDKTGCPGE
jgi:PilZ domain